MARSLRCAGARPGDVVHNAYGYGLFTGGLGAHYGAERLGGAVVPMSGGSTERQVALIVDFGARVLCATPSYALAIAEVAEQQGVDLRKSGAARRPVRRRALERGDAPRDRGAARPEGDRHLRPVRDHGPGRGRANASAAGRPARLGGPLPVRGDRPRHAAARARRRGRRAGDHHADQAGAADAALPHARHHAPDHRALRLRAHAAAHPARHRAQRRHADHPRRQRLSVADRGGAGRPARHRAALPAGGRAPRQPGPRERRGRGAAGRAGRPLRRPSRATSRTTSSR